MIKLVLIRHFATQGNLAKRYIGRTEEPLCVDGRKALEWYCYPEVEALFVSPMLRCIESAKLIYPKLPPVVIEELRECDFGEFENKNYMELSDNPSYQAWIDSNGTLPFPGGEDPVVFKERSIKGFQKAVEMSLESGYESIGLVVHGGTIMSILERYSTSKKDYYSWQVDNAQGYCGIFDGKEERIRELCKIQ